jgi:hypothetical protein
MDQVMGGVLFAGRMRSVTIFFRFSLAKFMWVGVRELLSCDWNPEGAAEFIAIVHGLPGSLREYLGLPLRGNVESFGTL